MAEHKIKYATVVTVPITLASLGSSSTHVAGRESDLFDNSTTLYVDAIVTGKITTGTSPTANKSLIVWVVPQYDDSSFPDVFDGTDSAETVTSESVRNAAIFQGISIQVTSTSDQPYPFKFNLEQVCGFMPRRVSFFVTQDTTVALNATGGNHELKVQGITYQSA